MISKGWPSCAKDGDKLAGPECRAKYERSMRKAFVAAVVTLAIAVAGTACDEPQATDSPGPEPVDRVQRSQAGPQPPTAFPASPQPPTAPQASPQPPTAAQVQTPTPSPTPSPPPTPSPTPVPPPTSTPEPTAAPAEIPLSAPDILEASAAAMQALESRGGLVCLNSAARFDKWNRAAVR